MMKMLQCPKTSQYCLVESMNGYEGWTVIAEGVRKPLPGEEWDANAKNWRDNPDYAEKERRKNIANPEYLLSVIDDLTARLDDHQERIAELKQQIVAINPPLG